MMPTSSPRRARQAGFTLVQVLIGMTMTAAVMGAGFSLFGRRAVFDTNQQRYDMMQNSRGALEEAQRVIRTMGAGVPNSQPVLVYGSNSVLAFNTDYIEQDTVDTRWAACASAEAPSTQTISWDVASATQHSDHVVHLSDEQLSPRQRRPVSGRDIHVLLPGGCLDVPDRRLRALSAGQQRDAADRRAQYPGAPERQAVLRILPAPRHELGDTLITEPSGNLPLERLS